MHNQIKQGMQHIVSKQRTSLPRGVIKKRTSLPEGSFFAAASAEANLGSFLDIHNKATYDSA